MTRTVLAMTEAEYVTLVRSLDDDRETAFVGLFGLAHAGIHDELTVCTRDLVPVPEHTYVERSAERLLIASTGLMPVLGRAAHQQALGGFVHSHPQGQPRYSSLDDIVDDELSAVAFLRTSRSHYVSLIVAGTSNSPRFCGRVMVQNEGIRKVDAVRVVGHRIRLIPTADASHTSDESSGHFDRQVRAFGIQGQQVLQSLSVGIAGAGGTGSSVCEQLVRLGVRHIVLADDDVITESNVSRVYGSRSTDEGRPKVEVVSTYMSGIRGDVQIERVIGRVTTKEVVERFKHCDVVFGCTDDQLGRSVLARLAYWYLIPLIDIGVVITSTEDQVKEIIGRVTFVGPGYACLLCRGRIQSDALRVESLPPEERGRLVAEGYVHGLGEPDPSVVTYTTLLASLATSALLERLFGFGDDRKAGETLIRVDRGQIRHNQVDPRSGHYCADPAEWGLADGEPFLGQLWT